MKCQVCKTKEAREGSIVCSDKCNTIRLKILSLVNKYTPTHGCDNCWGDLHETCSLKCIEETERAREFTTDLYSFIRIILNN